MKRKFQKNEQKNVIRTRNINIAAKIFRRHPMQPHEPCAKKPTMAPR